MKFKKIYIELTNHCNLSCSFCSKDTREKQFIKVTEFEHILKEIKPYTKTIYLHVKGEPLLHPKLDALLTLTDNNLFRVNITTNGVFLPKNVEIINKHPSVKKLNISLHAEYKDSAIIEEILEESTKLREDIIVIFRLWTLKGKELDKKSTNIVERLKRKFNLSSDIVEKIKQEKNIKINERVFVDKEEEFTWPQKTSHKSCGYCMALKTQIAILVDGTVVPCCLDSNGVINLGNIYKESFESILSSPRLQALRSSFQDRKPSEELCQSCTFKEKLLQFSQGTRK